MLTHPTVEKLHQLRCAGMAKALTEQFGSTEVEALRFEERLGLIVDHEFTERASRHVTNRLRRARLRHAACIEDIDFRQPRGLDRDLVLSLADGSATISMSSSRGRPAWERVGYLALSPTARAATDTTPRTGASRAW